MTRLFLLSLLFITSYSLSFTQDSNSNIERFGKLYPVNEDSRYWLQGENGAFMDDSWLDKAQKSTLRFGGFCTASFISSEGLILTNYHCSFDKANAAQLKTENFTQTGYYALNKSDERKVKSLFVDQLILTKNINTEFKELLQEGGDIKSTKKVYISSLSKLEEYKNLKLEIVDNYNGYEYYLHAYKRFDDVRLVFLPESAVGSFGGEMDNFSFPRTTLDFALWRIYDEYGSPLNSSNYHFTISTNESYSVEELYSLGYPGSTDRYETLSELNIKKNYDLPFICEFMDLTTEHYKNKMEELHNVPGANSHYQKLLYAYKGSSNYTLQLVNQLEGLRNDTTYSLIQNSESIIYDKSNKKHLWDELALLSEQLKSHATTYTSLKGLRLSTAILSFVKHLYNYLETNTEDIDNNSKTNLETKLANKGVIIKDNYQQKMFRFCIQSYISILDDSPVSLKLKDSVEYLLSQVFTNSLFKSRASTLATLKMTRDIIDQDPFSQLANIIGPHYFENKKIMEEYLNKIDSLDIEITHEIHDLLGHSAPPDANSTFRISPGKSQHTIDVSYTTFKGMINKCNDNPSLSLPEKWTKLTSDILSTPFNFTSTHDAIGGSSGSPIVNQNLEIVGILFDSNSKKHSYPEEFIYSSTDQRTINLDIRAILAALTHVYKADRLLEELGYTD